MAGLCGAFPPALIESACFRGSFFEADGALRFRPDVPTFP